MTYNAQWLANPYGQTGFDLAVALAQLQSGGQGSASGSPEGGGYAAFNPLGPGVGLLGNVTNPSAQLAGIHDPNVSMATGGIQLNGQNYVQIGDPTNSETAALVKDPSKITYDPKYGFITDPGNLRSNAGNLWDQYGGFLLAGIPAAAIIGGALTGSGVAASGEGAAASGVGETGLGSFSGVADPYSLEGLGGASGAEAGIPGSMGPGGLGAGGLDPETMSGMGGMSVAQNGIGPGSLSDILAGTLNNPSSLLGRGGDLLGSAASYLMSNPMTALGLLQMGGGLLSRRGSTSAGSGGGSSKGGGSGSSGLNVPARQFYTNPYTLRQLQGTYGAPSTFGG